MDPFSNVNDAVVEVWEWKGNLILYFTGHLIIYPCWHLSQSMLVKGAQV